MSYRAQWLLVGLIVATPPLLACSIKPPDGLHRTMVGEKLVANGVPMSIVQIESREVGADLLARTVNAWKDAGFNVKVNKAAGWDVVSALTDSCMATLQLIDHGGAFGYFSLVKRQQTWTEPAMSGAPIPGGATVTSRIASNDDGRRGLTLAMTSTRSMDDLNGYFLNELRRAGWGSLDSHEIRGSHSQSGTLKVTAQRERERIEIVVWQDQQTRIVMNMSDAL